MLYIFSIKDRAANAFMRPWTAPSTGLANRTFSDEVNRADEQNNMFHHPSDFELYQIGSFDDSSGTISALEVPLCLARAEDVKTTV